MHFRRRLELEHGLKQITAAPLIDMIFLLLIFFMLTSGFLIQPGIKINLPRVVTSEAARFENIELVISGENVVYLNGEAVTREELKSMLSQAAKRKQPVLIKADRRAFLGRAVEIWDMCRDLGISQINIATDQE
jgi:biopolymer transport protein ExbD